MTRSASANQKAAPRGKRAVSAAAPNGANETDTRDRVIQAAIDCILERGFYRSSSNAIAESAGLTWGVIQYYFGSRESLMLAVLDEGNRRLTERLRSAHIQGDSMSGRLEQYFDLLEGYYGQAEYLAFVQVLLNLSHDPTTSEQTLDAMTTASKEIQVELQRLSKELFAGTGVRSSALIRFPFVALRGLALNEVMLRTLPFDSDPMVKRVPRQRKLLTQAVSLLLESEGVEVKP